MAKIDLKSIRKDCGLTQKEVAKELGVEVAAYSKIETGSTRLTVDRLLILSSVFDLSPEQLLNYDVESQNVVLSEGRKNATYVPVAAQAGFLNECLPEHEKEGVVKFSLPIFYENDLVLINLEGDSMYPTFCNGDHVLVKQLGANYQIKWGEPYLITTNDGQVIKRVMKSDSKVKLLLKSDNELYQPYEIDRSIIRSIWEVRGVISKNLTSRLAR